MSQSCTRIQTASPFTRQRHHLNLMKQMKSIYALKHQKTTTFQSCHQSPTYQVQLPTKSKSRHVKSEFYQKIHEIQKIRGKKKAPKFSIEKDQKLICQNGWSEVALKIDKQMQKSIQRARERVRNLKKRNTVSNICIKNTMKPHEHQMSEVGKQNIKDLWELAKGGNASEERYFRLTDLSKTMKNSVVLKNAYESCLHSKHYSQSIAQNLKGQKLVSYVYLNENKHKLPQKKKNELMKNNFFLE